MATSLAMLAETIGGRLTSPAAGAALMIHGAATLDDAEPGDISLLDSPDKAHWLSRSRASAVVVPEGFVPDELPAIQVSDVHAAFGAIVAHFHPPRAAPRRREFAGDGQSDGAAGPRRGDSSRRDGGRRRRDRRSLDDSLRARLLPGCVIGRSVVLYPNVVLYENTIVGDRSVIHAGAVLGAHGFGYKLVAGQHQLSAQLGHVRIGCDVEIGACSTIDRGTYSATVIGDGTKIDNQVMIAHNCRIGRHNLICSQVGIAGSTTTGDYVVMAGQVGVRDHVHIGTGAVLGAKSGVSNDVADGAHMLGTPAIPLREQKLKFALMARLPEMRQQLKQIERQLETLLAAPETEPNPKGQAA